jgi:Na(+)-translocating NADH:ubiquinone oxidoreductase A subunit
MKPKSRKFSCGYKFRNFAGEPKEELVEIGIPEKVIIPLTQGSGSEVPPIVKLGESVKAGQIIGVDDDSISNPVHSTVNGVVAEITTIAYPDKETAGVIIESDGTSHWEPLETQSAAWARLSREDIERILYLSGVASLDREGIPTGYKSSTILPDNVEHIIIRGVGSEVYNPSLNVLVSAEKIPDFVQGLRILNRVMPSASIHLAFDMYQRQLIRQISLLIESYNWIDVFSLEPKYPQESDEVIIPTILDKELPYGHPAAQMRVVVLSVQTILHIYEAIVEGKPVIERVVALGGTGFKESHHVRLRIGTPLEYLIRDRVHADKDVRFVLNSPLTGVSLPDLSLPVDRQFTSIIALPDQTTRQFLDFVRPGFGRDSYSRTFVSALPIFKKESNTNIHGEERPCVSCGFCDEVCPARIIPHLIYKYVERNVIDEALINLKISDCIECNLCSYVCPSKIPLARFIKEGKEKLIEEGYVGQF